MSSTTLSVKPCFFLRWCWFDDDDDDGGCLPELAENPMHASGVDIDTRRGSSRVAIVGMTRTTQVLARRLIFMPGAKLNAIFQ
mmetsp:Transcript_19298/g.40694  ORF Transcript_19298/g.40694 Transcript_19298/m.40694 type:complete len:83 (-) Transcript_19298:66-314(-)